MSKSVPYPLNPNISCVERVRSLFCEIAKRRLIGLARSRPNDFVIVNDWILDVQLNIVPVALFDLPSLTEVWSTISKTTATREFILGLCFELRMRAFEEDEDFEAFINMVSKAATQFNDELTVMSLNDLQHMTVDDDAHKLLAGNVWVITVLLLEQLSAEEIGLGIALEVHSATVSGEGEE